ncbi:MAG TPA: prepilin-type N-terminal cleavage/methylation domain-containing protein [Verrucomicrobiales bacterium]|jgi:prepilin-type N-terminal cleavage/methylation domain-containing protein|nr:prepilin-type N-terminal cleavage/methylation domain-containing protein [Verrucomicrobiales bacterium]
MRSLSFSLPRRRGFTLLELMLVIALVAVLVLMTWNGYAVYVKKADSVACMTKLRNLGVGLANYVSDKQTWPQEDVLNDAQGKPPGADKLWDWWYQQMKEYGIGKEDWFCPAELRKRPMSEKDKEAEEDEDESGFKPAIKEPTYIPMKFAYGEHKPFEYMMPWVTERADWHGTGMNKLMWDGTIQKEFSFDAIKKMRQGGQ